jgi:acyl-CoA thioester hydrolase/thioesterase-3
MSKDPIEHLQLTTRGYELSSTGIIPPAQFLRYLEHVRWTMIGGSEKLPLREYFTLGVVRSQVLELFSPVGFGVELDLSMWVSRVGRTSFDMSHEITEISNGKLVGRSTATVVALDSDRRPAPLPDGARTLVVERPAPEPDRLAGAPPEDAFERKVEIRPTDHDLQGHVNHARYAELLEDTRVLAAAAGGYGPMSHWDGSVRRLSIAYEREARAGDPVVAHTFRTPGKERSLEFVLSREGVTLTRARVDV